MLKRTCCPGWTKAHSRIMQGIPRVAAVDQHRAMNVVAQVKAHHRKRQNAILQRQADKAWQGWGRAAYRAEFGFSRA